MVPFLKHERSWRVEFVVGKVSLALLEGAVWRFHVAQTGIASDMVVRAQGGGVELRCSEGGWITESRALVVHYERSLTDALVYTWGCDGWEGVGTDTPLVVDAALASSEKASRWHIHRLQMGSGSRMERWHTVAYFMVSPLHQDVMSAEPSQALLRTALVGVPVKSDADLHTLPLDEFCRLVSCPAECRKFALVKVSCGFADNTFRPQVETRLRWFSGKLRPIGG